LNMSYRVQTLTRLSVVAVLLGCAGKSVTSPAATSASPETIAMVRAAAVPLTGGPTDYDPLLALVGNARVVLLGESTHGTHEFYVERTRIAQRLITDKGFNAIAIEGDWPDAYRVNSYIRGEGTDQSAEQALSSFTRFPSWMWRNEEARDLVVWLRNYNMTKPADQRVGFYGLDVYSLYPSIDAVLAYLRTVDETAAGRARSAYQCFESYRPDASSYGAATATGANCKSQAEQVLQEMEERSTNRPADAQAEELLFSALRNAKSVVNAEAYFRTSYLGGMSTWNLRDANMSSNLEAIERHLQLTTGRPPKIMVWAHNTHTGDARHTEAGDPGEFNIGQLTRQRLPGESALIGFFTYSGEVVAASQWDAPGIAQPIRNSLPESFTAMFHATALERFLLLLRGGGAVQEELSKPRLERAIGVVYAPATERQSHYFQTKLAQAFDAAVFIDRTTPVRPLK
jgi:erythromycin esterase-like protein